METYVSSLLWSISWQVTVLFFILLIADKIITHPSPLFRYLLWCIVPVRLLVPVPIPFISDIMQVMGRPAIIAFGTVSEFTQHQLNSSLESFPYTSPGSVSGVSFSPIALLVICWLGIIIALFINRFIKILYLRDRISRYQVVDDAPTRSLLDRLRNDLGIKTPVDIIVMGDNDGSSPMVTGLIKPKILLPPYLLEQFDEQKLEPILLHELVHIKRGDLWINWLLSIVHIFYFFHPVVWIVNAKLLALSEDICDDLSILYLEGSKKAYFNSILMVLERIAERGKLLRAEACCIERKSSLSKRIIRLTRPSYTYYRPLSLYSFGTVMIIGILGIGISAGSVTGRTVEQVPGQQSRFVLVAYGSKRIQLRIHAGDTFEIDSEQVTFSQLKQVLQEQMIEKKTNRLTVLIDTNVNELTLTSINDLAFRIGYREISVSWMSFDDTRSVESFE